MIATRLDVDFEAEIREWQRKRSRGRSEGRHQSEIIHRIAARLDPKRFTDQPYDPTQGQMGYIWEEVLAAALTRIIPGIRWQLEIESDGILQTMDGWRFEPRRVVEAKATKMSARNPIRSSKFDHWHMQIQGYCRTMKTTEAELYPFFLNGSYELAGGKFGKMIPVPWLIRYTPREIEENWSMLLRERDAMDREERGRRWR